MKEPQHRGVGRVGGVATAVLALRSFAVCAGLFAGVNALVALADGGVDSNLWWIDLRVQPLGVRTAAELLAAALLVGLGLRPRLGRRRARASQLVFGVFGVWALRDGIVVLLLDSGGTVAARGLPLSFVVAGCFATLVRASAYLGRSTATGRAAAARPVGARVVAVGVGAALFLVGLPLAEIAAFGATDYRRATTDGRPALGVVLGAGVRADGTPSLALSDRVLTGVELYHQGVVADLLVSGGPSPGAVHETEAMRDLALERGVPAERIHLDARGLSTWDTAANTAARVRGTAAAPGRVFAVSHAYHVPRVELAFQRHGIDVLTVPARETRPLARRHYFALREVAGFWVYWARRVPAALGRRGGAATPAA